MEKPQYKDLPEAQLTWAGKHFVRGYADGYTEGRTEVRRKNIADLAGPLQFELTPERQRRLATMTALELDVLWRHLIAHRAWPSDER